MRSGVLVLACLGASIAVAHAQRSTTNVQPGVVHVVVETSVGTINVDVDTARAPITARNFLRYVDGHFYDGGQFHRTVRADNQPTDSVKIGVIQAKVSALLAGSM